MLVFVDAYHGSLLRARLCPHHSVARRVHYLTLVKINVQWRRYVPFDDICFTKEWPLTLIFPVIGAFHTARITLRTLYSNVLCSQHRMLETSSQLQTYSPGSRGLHMIVARMMPRCVPPFARQSLEHWSSLRNKTLPPSLVVTRYIFLFGLLQDSRSPLAYHPHSFPVQRRMPLNMPGSLCGAILYLTYLQQAVFWPGKGACHCGTSRVCFMDLPTTLCFWFLFHSMRALDVIPPSKPHFWYLNFGLTFAFFLQG
jgi:hypothetical protein